MAVETVPKAFQYKQDGFTTICLYALPSTILLVYTPSEDSCYHSFSPFEVFTAYLELTHQGFSVKHVFEKSPRCVQTRSLKLGHIYTSSVFL